jgi:hypothetical protein
VVNQSGNNDAAVEWQVATRLAMKKITGRYTEHLKRAAEQQQEEANRLTALTEARQVIIREDPTLPNAIQLLDRTSSEIPATAMCSSLFFSLCRVSLSKKMYIRMS